MTHHHPTGYLGSLAAAALFTSYAIQGKPINSWGSSLVDEVLPRALGYVRNSEFYVDDNAQTWDYFKKRWIKYLEKRKLKDGTSNPEFPEEYGIKDRDLFYKTLSFDGWGGASGHDAPMIAYDALLGSKGDWKELCSRGMFHSGDSDSTGVIAACCYGAMHGFQGVPECNYKRVEYRDRLETAAEMMYSLSHPEASDAELPPKVRKTEEIDHVLPSVPSSDDLENSEGGDTQNTDEAKPTDEYIERKLKLLKEPSQDGLPQDGPPQNGPPH